MGFHFTKWHGLGNDFVIVDCFKETIRDYRGTAIQVCDRHLGVGADGLVAILPSDVADFRMRIFNSDGSEAEMCGNVTRCVARYVYERGLTDKTKISLQTGAGIIIPELLFAHGKITGVCVDMGQPKLKRGEIPVQGNVAELAVNVPLTLADETYSVTCLSMGNPHCVIFVSDIDKINLSQIGPKIETHGMFPNKVNVEFAQILDGQNIRMRVWERGAGITLACGTGACATLAASVLNDKTDRKASIHLDGGTLEVEWDNNNHVFMSGPAVEVFRGEYIL
ncbi:Diaminopimelate epimerase [Propionispora sp. 2/2-37]|uniref:diaminopimelate epimerase n=1 Tax=Propionispora sp. 2/2-37 TaxID=1677858 RepID=UPI0006BB6A9E|nr:diaminopimelate epimerase [Propionispora sp. 2/2-37]CUH94203.1 Diaminopimelate epimerase [Propionispora sp. 2/2-37]